MLIRVCAWGGGNPFIMLVERRISPVSMKVFVGFKTTKQNTLRTDPNLLVLCIYRKDSKCPCHREASNPRLKQHHLQKPSNRTNPCAHQQMNKENMVQTQMCVLTCTHACTQTHTHMHIWTHTHAHKEEQNHVFSWKTDATRYHHIKLT